MIEVEHDFRFLPAQFLGVSHSTFSHVAQQRLVGVVAGTFRHLKDNGGLGLGSSHDDGLKLFHVVEVESGDGIAALDCLGKHLAGVHKA